MIIPNHNYTARERTVCDLLAPLTNVRRMLNVGMRHPGDPRNLWWINICKANGTETHVLEVFEPNCRELRAAGIENVVCADVRDARSIYQEPCDVILWWHGPEHVERTEAPAVIDGLWRLTEGTLIVGCPLGDEPQGICYGNQHERHLSCWQPPELAALGFETSVVRDERPCPHITAWRRRSEVVAARSQETGEESAECGTRSAERAEGTREDGTGGRGDAERGEAATTGAIAKCELQNANCKLEKGTSAEPEETGANAKCETQNEKCKLAEQSTTSPIPASPCPLVSASDLLPSSADPLIPSSFPPSASSFIPHLRQVGISPQAQPSSLRVAIVFDDKTRPETTGVYCRRALAALAEVVFFHPDDLANVPRTGFDLYLAIDDGLDYPWPGDLRPCAYWAIDTHMDFERCLRRAEQVDFVFAAQKDGAERLLRVSAGGLRVSGGGLRGSGIETAQWLPLACDPEIHGKQEVPRQYDVCFVGNLFPGPRTDLVRLIRQYVRKVFVGNAYFEEMARVYSASKIVFNRSLRSDLNMRVFEALASGSLLVTNDLAENGQRELFRDGVHLVTYSDGDELVDKLRYYLRRDDLRERIAAAGRAEVLAKHTYRHRMEEMLAVVTRAIAKCKLQNANCKLEECASAECGEASAECGARSAEQGNNDQTVTNQCPDDRQFAESPLARGAGAAGPRSGRRDVPTRSVGTSNQQLATSRYYDPSYFEFDRPEVLALVPATARTVLEIGCGHGRLGEALKARQECEVVGIELNEQAAAVARGRLDRVFDGDIERMAIERWDGYFDAVIAADVLEHLSDPGKQLGRIRGWLKPDGVVVASIPNVRHASVVKSLLDGNWTYEPAGILDTTHLHFFTRRDIQKLFEQAGYSVASWAPVPGDGYDEWVRQGRPLNIDLGRIQLTGMPEQEAEEFFVYQWLVVGKAAEEAKESEVRSQESEVPTSAELGTGNAERADGTRGLGDAETGGLDGDGQTIVNRLPSTDEHGQRPGILTNSATGMTKSNPQSAIQNPQSLPPCLLLMITYNRLDYTRLSLESVLALDYPNLQIVVWDNASTDGTVEFLRQRLAAVSHARLVTSPVNRGVVYPMNAVWCSEGGVFPGEVSAERSFAERKATMGGAELLAKVDNDTWVPADLLLRLAECHARSQRFGVLSGFHFRGEGEAMADDSRVSEIDGVRMLAQPYVGGCAVMVRRSVLDALGPITCRTDVQPGPFMDSGWTLYQQRMNDEGLVNGYPWPPIHVDHMEDVRSPRCIRTAEHQEYKQALRGMSLEQFTEELCVWRPIWGKDEGGRMKDEDGNSAAEAIPTRSASKAAEEGIRETRVRSQEEAGDSLEKGKRGAGEKGSRQQTVARTENGELEDVSSPKCEMQNEKCKLEESQRPTPNAQRLFFTQDFAKDFDQFDFRGPPFAFVRFADGERAICTGQPIRGMDGWSYEGGSSPFRDALLAALRYSDPGYYIGISDGCCDPEAKAWYLREITVPLSHVTFSNIFVNGNYRRFRQLDLSDAATVACEGGDFWVPEHLVNTNFNIDELVERLLQVDRTILVSAGPAAAVIIHRYWLRASAPRRQAIVDVGSAIDEWTKGRKTRQYQMPGTRNAALVCAW